MAKIVKTRGWAIQAGGPRHLRYVGTEATADVVRSGGVLETAWGFAPASDYR